MKYFIPYDITILDSDIGEFENADGTINTPWSNDEQINGAGAVRQYNNRIYKSLRKINPLVTYIWQDADPLNKYNQTTADDSITDGTAVSIINGVTTIYVVSQEKYYIAKTTTTVDFTAEDYDAPANFNEITDNSLRYDYYIPDKAELFWSDQGVSNRTASVSKAINKYSTKDANTFYQEFTATSINTIVLYNTKVQAINIEIRTVDTDEIIQTETIDSIRLDFTSFREWFDSSLEIPNYDSKIIINADYYYIGEVKIRITLTNTLERPRIGEILAGRFADGGITLDEVSNPTETDSEITRNSAGELIFEGEGDVTKIYRRMNLNIKIPTASYNEYSDMTLKIINSRILVIGENTDDPIYQSLVLYGGVVTATPTLISNSTLSELAVEVREFNTGE